MGYWYLKVYFLKLNIYMYLRTKFQISIMILTRQGGILQIRVKIEFFANFHENVLFRC